MNQRHKLGYLLTALVGLPIFALGLIGLHALNTDLRTYQLQESKEANLELTRLDKQITSYLKDYQKSFKTNIETVHEQGAWALRCTFQESCPQKLSNRFILIVSFDRFGDQIYPPKETTGQLYSEMGKLRKIASSLSTAKESLSRLPLLDRKNGVWSNYLTPKGHNLLYCWLGRKNFTYCAAIDRAAIIDELGVFLTSIANDQTQNHIRLLDIHYNILWQNKDSYSDAISSQRQLSYPLYFWRLERLQNTNTTTNKFPLTLAALTLPIGSLLIFLAFTLFRDQKKILAEANDRANFAASISHELRTPLTNLQLYADLIRNKITKDTEQQQELSNESTKEISKYTEIIASETTRLSEMVNNALTIAKGNHPTIRKKVKAIPDHIIEETVTRLTPLLKDQINNLSFNLDTPNEVKIDRSALEQILVNLLDNARKYAADNNIRISSKIEGQLLILTVRDWGPSFSKGTSRSIFKPFSQSQKGDAKRDGFGLGLAVCEQLAKENDGTVKAEQANPGARFIVTLKIKQINQEDKNK
ncbi:ATP-binding protein [Hyphomicrobiales bacterium 4NK60-0047b]